MCMCSYTPQWVCDPSLDAISHPPIRETVQDVNNCTVIFHHRVISHTFSSSFESLRCLEQQKTTAETVDGNSGERLYLEPNMSDKYILEYIRR